jgi:hypothetical protein
MKPLKAGDKVSVIKTKATDGIDYANGILRTGNFGEITTAHKDSKVVSVIFHNDAFPFFVPVELLKKIKKYPVIKRCNPSTYKKYMIKEKK